MDIFNPTAERFVPKFNSRPFPIGPQEIITVDDETGQHILAKFGHKGLLRASFTDDPKHLTERGLVKALRWHKAVLRHHERTNEELKQKGFPQLVDSPTVARAKDLIPVYEKYVKELETASSKAAREKAVAEASAILEKALANPEIPKTDTMDLEELRGHYAELTGQAPQVTWNQRTLLARIRDYEESRKAKAADEDEPQEE